MNRREFACAFGVGTALTAAAGRVAMTEAAGPDVQNAPPPQAPAQPLLNVAMLVHPDMVLLDLIGPRTIFSLLMAKVHLVWKDMKPVSTDVGMDVQPTTTFADCPQQLDVLFVPGGLKGTVALAFFAAIARRHTGTCVIYFP